MAYVVRTESEMELERYRQAMVHYRSIPQKCFNSSYEIPELLRTLEAEELGGGRQRDEPKPPRENPSDARSSAPTAPESWKDEMTDTTLEGPLPVAFEKALNELRVVPLANVNIVLVSAYYRSGSSFFGELLSSGPRTFFHYEPLQIFSKPGRLRAGRERHAFQLLDQLVRCRMQNVPLYTAWLESRQSYKHNLFLANLCGDRTSCSCPSHVSALCSRAQTQVFKFTRLYISQVATWIERNTAFARNTRVVHLIRDPRGIYASRKAREWCAKHEECGTPEALCSDMRKDIEDFKKLTEKLSSSRTVTVRFEDLARNPYKETTRLFSRLGLKYGGSVVSYLQNHTVATEEDKRNPRSTRRNTSTVIDSWKRNLSAKIIGKIESACGDVMRTFGYEPLYLDVTGSGQN
ncbi:carbohydrate sulfotransferase 4-like [Dermacentor andersoni]|uniref:carbohydrate sulfotransferase 4-like n=1 Tax=Dermacentor andersoni TaxID=34620 RepID=UPI0021551858|nr:carbohydrate sulfotransferase 4-like [Dermacentor andersoni]